MKVEPSAADLLAIARATILAEIAPSLPEAKRYAALMAANALAIAGRDLAVPPDEPAEIARLAALLARRIREGRFDEGEPRARLRAHLLETTRARLAVSNPRALARDERKTP